MIELNKLLRAPRSSTDSSESTSDSATAEQPTVPEVSIGFSRIQDNYVNSMFID